MTAPNEPFPQTRAWASAPRRANAGTRPHSEDALSEREQDILLLSALGLCNKTIARRMNVSVRTIESCRSNLRDKLGTGTASRLEAMVRIILDGGSERLSGLLGVDAETVESWRLALRQSAN